MALTAAPLADRLPPQNIEAEQGVLGALLFDAEVMHDIIPMLKAEDFYRDAHQILYRTIRELYDQGTPLDLIILKDELTRRDMFDAIGGDETLVRISESVVHSANATFHAKIVREKSIGRQVIEISNENLKDVYSSNMTGDQLLEAAERRVFQIAEEQVTGETVQLPKLLEMAMIRIEERAVAKSSLTGVPTGYIDLDDLTGGFQPTQLVILAARPSMGKTALALNICEHVAIQLKKSLLFVSLEMGRYELAERLLCARAKVDSNKLRTGQNLGPREISMLGKAYDDMREAPLFIDDTPARNMLQITANARRLKLRHKLELVVIDYIQLIDAEENRDSRQEQIAKISRRLKTLARELQVPVIALSQLNRGVEQREDRRPRMSDLRESGAIEQDADLVLLLHRPEYYDPNDQPGISELNLAKNRSGATGTVKMTFLKNFTRFENLAHSADPMGDVF